MDAFVQALEQQRPRLRRLAMGWTRDTDEAEDIAQETIVRAFRKREQFQPDTNINAWTAVIARNVAINRYRRFHRSHETLSLDGLSETESGVALVPDHHEERQPEAMFWKREREAQIAKAIDRLSPEHRAVLQRAAIEDRPYEDIATELNIPVGTVRSRLFRARENLRNQVQ
ncbi:MAG TPA: sigma-70 family RNA polymerase sigma factor [Armatimonadota bacterium]|jgi:RNA polymerase sigma-70 factor (ECF subfamily)